MLRRIGLPWLLATGVIAAGGAFPANAGHSWGSYHIARTANPFTLTLGDNLTSQWKPFLAEAGADWSASSVLDTTVATGTVKNLRRCAQAVGKFEVCNAAYGNNGWLGVAGITVSGGHITSGYVKVNDTYYATSTYNTPSWRKFVMCQEVGHLLGLDHQDENFNNTNLGSCMDYTSNPSATPNNEHPNAHDYAHLESIYSHTDGGLQSSSGGGSKGQGKVGRSSTVDARGNGTVTFIVYA